MGNHERRPELDQDRSQVTLLLRISFVDTISLLGVFKRDPIGEDMGNDQGETISWNSTPANTGKC